VTGEFEALAREAYATWNRGDLEAFVGFTAPDMVIRPSGAFPDLPSEYRGHDGLRAFWRDVHEPWEELLIDVEAVEERDAVVFVTFRFRARGRDGMTVDARFFQVGTVRDGLVQRVEAYVDEAAARERFATWPAAGVGSS
jgi:ketosteroid isomerase-like protein